MVCCLLVIQVFNCTKDFIRLDDKNCSSSLKISNLPLKLKIAEIARACISLSKRKTRWYRDWFVQTTGEGGFEFKTRRGDSLSCRGTNRREEKGREGRRKRVLGTETKEGELTSIPRETGDPRRDVEVGCRRKKDVEGCTKWT